MNEKQEKHIVYIEMVVISMNTEVVKLEETYNYTDWDSNKPKLSDLYFSYEVDTELVHPDIRKYCIYPQIRYNVLSE